MKWKSVACIAIFVAAMTSGCDEDLLDPVGFCFIGDAPTQAASNITMASDETRDDCYAWAAREGMYVIRWEPY